MVGDAIDSCEPFVKTVGYVGEDAEARTEVLRVAVDKLGCGNVSEFDIEVGPMRLFCWREDPSNDKSIY